MDLSFLTSYIPLFITSIIAAHTPGPNNIMLLQGCILFGYKRTHPHRMGVVLGFLLLALIMNLVLSPMFQVYPITLIIVKICGSVYFLWFAYKIIFMNVEKTYQSIQDASKTETSAKPISFWQAFFFQWVNVKAIMYALSLTGLITDDNHTRGIIILILSLLLFTATSANLWSLMGTGLKYLLKNLLLVKIVNVISGLLILWFGINMWL